MCVFLFMMRYRGGLAVIERTSSHPHLSLYVHHLRGQGTVFRRCCSALSFQHPSLAHDIRVAHSDDAFGELAKTFVFVPSSSSSHFTIMAHGDFEREYVRAFYFFET